MRDIERKVAVLEDWRSERDEERYANRRMLQTLLVSALVQIAMLSVSLIHGMLR